MVDRKPIVGITAGDPAGIGPEVVIKALSDAAIREICRPVIIGDRANLEWTIDELGLKVNRAADQKSSKEIGRADRGSIQRPVRIGR